MWTCENYSSTPREEAYFSKAEKKMSVFKNIRIRVDRFLCPVHSHPFLFEKGGFFISGLSYHPHVSGENSHRKLIFSKTLSRVKIFENASLTDAIVFPLFSVLVWTGENNSNTLSMDAYIFWKRRKKISVSEISGYVWKGPLISKKLCACITRFGTLQDYDVQLPRFALNKRLQFPQIFSI